MNPDDAKHGGSNRRLTALRSHHRELIQPHLQRVALAAGQVLARPGQKEDFVYFPTKGLVCLVAASPDGSAIQSAAVGPEGSLNSMGGIGPSFSASTVVVQIAGAALRAPTERLQAAANESSQIRGLIVGANALLLAQIQQTAVCNTLHGMKARACRWLLDAAWRAESDLIPVTQDTLAGLLGLHRGSLNATLQELQRRGAVDVRERGRIALRDHQLLAAEACGCHAHMRKFAEQIAQRLGA